MRDGCEAFISGWTEELERVLIDRKDDESPIQELCYNITKVNFLSPRYFFPI